MTIGEIAGYLASVLVFATFYVRTMMPLRIIAIFSNVAFISYAALEGLVPVLLLHAFLLPVNISRLYEIKKLIESTRSSDAKDAPIDAIIPFMKQQHLKRGEMLFSKGDFASHMFYVVKGEVELVEIGRNVSDGAIIGEIGLFSPTRERTASARAATDCELLTIDDATLYQAYYQNPQLGFYLIRLIARRFAELQSPAPAQIDQSDDRATRSAS
jgi:hypothetical protein